MEEKNQAAERETKKDEAHEKDARNKRYVAKRAPRFAGGSRIRLRRGRSEAHFAFHRPVLTYIRFVINHHVILGGFPKRFFASDVKYESLPPPPLSKRL